MHREKRAMELKYVWLVTFPVRHPWEVTKQNNYFELESDAVDFVAKYPSLCTSGSYGPMSWYGNSKTVVKAVKLLTLVHDGESYSLGQPIHFTTDSS